MLAINNLSYFVGGRPLYQQASLHIKPKDKIGLIGLNGTGKSTLLRLIAGEYSPDEGEITRSNECSIGFLNQDLLSFQSDDSILSVAMQAFEECMRIQQQIDQLLHELETDYADDKVEKLTTLQERFEALGGYSIQSHAEELLEGIGFRTEDLQRPYSEFSGGWRMRVMLAKLLLEKPSLLMLDEPTNHLDLPSIEWIENYLRNYEGAVIVVSHDRQFLDNTISTTVEVARQKLHSYSGNYSFYLEEKELREEIQRNAYANQQQAIKQTERFIERFRAKATKARQVQSRVKALERMDMIEEVQDGSQSISFQFRFKQKSGRFLRTLKDVSKAYGDLEIFNHANAQVERGDKIALIGANGKGKSTLLRIIAGTETIQGEVEDGYNVNLGFYAQHQLEALNVDNEILDELKQAGTDKTEQELRGILGSFLFLGDDVFKKIKVLSGGEKSRVALAKTLISESNFLILDEPTNHLDFISENILIQALQQYEGTFIVVSHNRHFISQIANKVWTIEDQQVREYPGTYEEYHYWLSKQTQEQQIEEQKVNEKKPAPPRKSENQKNVKRLEASILKLEEKIEMLEEQVKSAEETMGDPEVYQDAERLQSLQADYEAAKTALNETSAEWAELSEQLENIQN